jgi:Tfp pilus assembly protein PilN
MKAVNLIPTEQRGGGTVGSRSEGAVFAVLGLLAGVVVLTLLYGLAHHELSTRRNEAAALAARAQQAQAQAAELASYTSFVALREQRLQAISTLIGSRFDWSAAMGELSRVLPSDVALSSLQGTIGAGTATASPKAAAPAAAASATASASAVSSATPPGATPSFTLTGCAASQVVVAQTLVRLHLISGVDDVTLQSSAKSGSAGASSGGSCPNGDPTFSAQIAFQPLPTPPSSSIEALESTTPASSTAPSSSTTPASSTTTSSSTTPASSTTTSSSTTPSSSTGGSQAASGGRALSSARTGGNR